MEALFVDEMGNTIAMEVRARIQGAARTFRMRPDRGVSSLNSPQPPANFGLRLFQAQQGHKLTTLKSQHTKAHSQLINN